MRALSLIGLAATLGLAACADGSHVDSYNRSVDSVHQPVVQRHDYIIDIASAGTGLAAGEANRLDEWFSSLQVRYGDQIAVDTGGVGNDAAVSGVASVAAAHGLGLHTHAPITQGMIPGGAVRVIVSRMTASVPGCPDHHEGALAKFNATTTTNYGCATNASLAAMVANPEDLVRGQNGATSAYTVNQVNGLAIQTYYTTVGKNVDQVKSESSKGGN